MMRQSISRRDVMMTGAMLGAGSLLGGGDAAGARTIAGEAHLSLPAPPVLPAFGPIRLAQGKGYFKDAGFEVEFAVGRGGVDVAKQVGAGNAPLGGIVADGPIMVRGNGVPVKIVRVFGGKGFMQIVVREDSGIEKPADLKGKTITVMSYQDTTFYALLGLMASAGLTQNDVNVQQVGPTESGSSSRKASRRAWPACRIDPAGAGRRRQGEDHPDRDFLPAHGAGDRGVRRHHQAEA
jgi:NitT/TauT family transport system substrate-binding protein